MSDLTQTIQRLRSSGQKMTRIRKQILGILLKPDSLIDAQTLQTQLERLNLKVNKSTIYREITFLLNQEIIKSIDFGDGKKRYEIDQKDHHHHLVCLNCQSVDHFNLEDDLTLEEILIKREKKFKIINHSLEFFGLCQNCQKI